MPITVVIADDHGIVRSGIDLILQQADDMDIIGQAVNGFEAIDVARQLKPDVMLMDISMPGLNGIDAAHEILSDHPEIKIIALSAHGNRRFVRQALSVGMQGYVTKDILADVLIEAIRVVYAGQRYLCKNVVSFILEDYAHGHSSKSRVKPIDRLTTKERELLQLIAENKTTKEAAKLLHVSVKTIEARRLNITKKLNVTGIADLTKIAIREGLTTVDF